MRFHPFLIAFVLLTACSTPTPTAETQDTQQDTQQETMNVTYSQYKNEARGIFFDYPSDWKLQVKSDTDENMNINIQSPASDPDPTNGIKEMNFSNITFFLFETGKPASPESFRDFVENLLAQNGYDVVEKGESMLGDQNGLYIIMQKSDEYFPDYLSLAKYVVSARDTKGYYLALTYDNEIGEAKTEEYLSIFKHMTDSFVWEENE